MVGRFVNFFKSLLLSKSPEVKMMANIAGRCARSTTGKNLLNIQIETSLDPWNTPAWKVHAAVEKSPVPVNEKWRLQYLMKLIEARQEMKATSENTDDVTTLIDSLCSS